MIDVHCHLQFEAYKESVDEVIQEAFAKGVTRIINVGTKIDSSQGAVKLAEKYENLWAIVGVHPHHADKVALQQEAQDATKLEDWIHALETLVAHPKVLGIGEIGMDYYRYQSNGIVDPLLQREIFEKQIDLAYRYKLPLQIHNRQAGEDVIKILRENSSKLLANPGMFHCFAGSLQVLHDALDLGFSIGFDGNITYPGLAPGESVDLREIATMVPLDRLVVETDSPYLTPIPYRGKKNSPAYVIITGQFIAELKQIPYEVLVDQTTINVYTIFTKLK